MSVHRSAQHLISTPTVNHSFIVQIMQSRSHEYSADILEPSHLDVKPNIRTKIELRQTT